MDQVKTSKWIWIIFAVVIWLGATHKEDAWLDTVSEYQYASRH